MEKKTIYLIIGILIGFTIATIIAGAKFGVEVGSITLVSVTGLAFIRKRGKKPDKINCEIDPDACREFVS